MEYEHVSIDNYTLSGDISRSFYHDVLESTYEPEPDN